MAGTTEDEIPESGAVFTFGKSKFAENMPSKFWLKNDLPLKVLCGDEHTALITEKGKLFMFGSNNWGQLGLGEKTSVNKPTRVKALKPEMVILVACGRTHTLVYTSHGNLYAAGGNNEGQLGLGDIKERTSFQLVDYFTKCGPIKMLTAGSNTSAALTQDGKLFVWGDNSEGQIGLGKKEGTSLPHELSTGKRVAWISCGYYHSAFVTEDGALFTFGERDSGKLGLSTAQLPNHRVPQQVESMSEPVLQVACGGEHTVALTEKCLYSFGLGQFGQLGHGTFVFESRMPKVVEHFCKGRVKHIACGENHTAVITDSGLLYTFGDGRHGKLALGEEIFVNRFKPTLCSRFLRYNVHSVSCGGCHMLVLAKPRIKGSEAMILEDNDVSVVYQCGDYSYTELLMELDTRPNLKRSLSARHRRRERERSPEQFGMTHRTLPPLSSRNLSVSLPVSSQTLPSQLPSTEMHSNSSPNGFQRIGITGNMTTEHEVDGQSFVAKCEDNESVKDLGETVDLLNITHVINTDAGEKTLTLSPVHKRKVKVGKKCSQGLEQPAQDPSYANGCTKHTMSKSLSADLPRHHKGNLLPRESRLSRMSCQSSSSDKENAMRERRPARHKTISCRTKPKTQSKNLTESKSDLPIHVARQSHLLEFVCEIEPDTKQPKRKDESSQETLSNSKVIPRLIEVKGSETETTTEACTSKEKVKRLRQKDSGKAGSTAHQGSEAKIHIIGVQENMATIKLEEIYHKPTPKNSQTQADEGVPKAAAAKITQMKLTNGESEHKVANGTSEVMQSKSQDNTVKTDARCNSTKQMNRNVLTGDRSTKEHNPARMMTSTSTRRQKTSAGHLMAFKAATASKDFESSKIDLKSESTESNAHTEVPALIKKLRMESPVHLLPMQSLSRAKPCDTSQTSSCNQSTNKLREWNIFDAVPICEISHYPQGQANKRKVITINVMPEDGPSDDEIKRSSSQYQSEAQFSEGESEDTGGGGQDEIGQLSQEEEVRTREMIVKRGEEDSKAVSEVTNGDSDGQEDSTTLNESSVDEAEVKEEKCETETEQSEADMEVSSHAEDDDVPKIRRKAKETKDDDQEEPRSKASNTEEAESDGMTESQSEKPEQESGEESLESEIESEVEKESGKVDDRVYEKGNATHTSEEEDDSDSKVAIDEEEDEAEHGNQTKGEDSATGEEEESETTERESDIAEKESETAEQESDTAEKESETTEEESDTAEKESEASEQVSDTAEEESETSEQVSDTAEEESETVEQESDTAEEEHETSEEQSSAGEEEGEEGEEEESKASDKESEKEDDSETGEEESEADQEESTAGEGESEADEESGETDDVEEKGESETGDEESDPGEEESEVEDEEEEKDSNDSEAEEEEQNNQEEEESEVESDEEEEDEAENEEDKDQEEAVKDVENDGEEGVSEITEEEDDEAKKKQKKIKSVSKSSYETEKARRCKKSLVNKRQFKSEPQEPQQFWNDVLPHYLNLK